MKKVIFDKHTILFFLFLSLLFSGCGPTDTSSDKVSVPKQNDTIRNRPALNLPPVADAGETIIVEKNQPFTFDARKSYDPDGKIISYEWYCPDLNISLYKGSKNTLTIPAQRPIGDYNTTLIVTDDKNATSIDYVLVKIVPPKFIADAGENFQVLQNDYFTLNAGNSFYHDGKIVTYEWIYTDNNITLYKGSESESPLLKADRSPGAYKIKLIITNDKNQTAIDNVTIHIEESPDNQFKDIYDTGITIEQFKKLQEENIVYIDVRRSSEWHSDTGIIEGSYLITKPDDINTWLTEGSEFLDLVTDKNQSFILICLHGGRAESTATKLKDKGYSKVHYLIGGIDNWINNGEPTVTAP
jgi:rhodanese-related sulfurtransferase